MTTYIAGQQLDLTGLQISVTDGVNTGNPDSYYTVPAAGDTLTTSNTHVYIYGTFGQHNFTTSFLITVVASNDVYLDPVNGDDDDPNVGDVAHPYQSLDAALTAAGTNGTVYIMNSITISGTATYNNGVTFKRYNGTSFSTAPLFVVNAPSDEIVTMTTMTVDGNGTGTLFKVQNGTLRLRGNITMTNCNTAVDVGSGGRVEVNKAAVSLATCSVKTTDASSVFVLDDYGGTSIGGTVKLGEGSYITLKNAIPNNMAVELAVPWSTAKLFVGDGYTITNVDLSRASCANTSWGVTYVSDLNAIIAHDDSDNCVYLKYGNGTLGSGSGTYGSPYENFTDALTAAGTTKPIYVLSTAKLGADVTLSGHDLRRATTCAAAMIEVPAGYTLTIGNGARLNGGMSSGVTDYNPSSTNGTGLIYISGGNAVLESGDLSNTKSKSGTVYVTSGLFKMSGGTIGKNSSIRGGAVYVEGGLFELYDGDLLDNYGGSGGAVCVNGGIFKMYGGTFAHNEASAGGGLHITSGSVEMSGGSITGNQAITGGGVSLRAGAFTMTGGTISGNTATGNGAGVYMTAGATFSLGCEGIGTNDVVYLANTSLTNCFISLTQSLSSNYTITVECAYDVSNAYVAKGNTIAIATDSLGSFSYYGGSHTFSRTGYYIKIA